MACLSEVMKARRLGDLAGLGLGPGPGTRTSKLRSCKVSG